LHPHTLPSAIDKVSHPPGPPPVQVTGYSQTTLLQSKSDKFEEFLPRTKKKIEAKLVMNFGEQRGRKLTHRLTIDSINAIIVTRTESDRLKDVDDRWPAIYIGRTLIASVFSGKCCTLSRRASNTSGIGRFVSTVSITAVTRLRRKKGDSTISLGWGSENCRQIQWPPREREIRIKRQICSIQRHSMHGADWIKRPILKEQRIIQWLALNF
jgi:hypothetical protein